ncbi:NIN-like protein [Artemisia annua]|uniref:NIN-like protein n=1 Tax=Artemisia annua TaxID=35608 RepID=A0A2U1PT60_ARTAN|nr:NIN-like protein [Artemisia annua]
MDHFERSQSVDSADRDKSACSGSLSVSFKDQITYFMWIKISLERPTVSLSGDLRYLTSLWVSRYEEPWDKLCRAKNIVPHHQKLNEMIRAALKLLTFREERVLVQFWSPLDVGKHQLLTTIDQPFGLGVIDEGLCSYRRDSERNVFLVDKDHAEEDISPPARVFRQGLSEWTSDLNNYEPKDFPQQECAIRCNLHGYLALPVFDSTTNLCVGVIELLMSSKTTDYAFEVRQVHKALKTQNLTSPQVFDFATPNVPSEQRQIELDILFGILKNVCDIHNLPLAQAWAVSPSTSFVSQDKAIEKTCSSFDTKCIGKVCMSTTALPFHVGDMGMWPFREACIEHHLDMSHSFVGKALLARGSTYCQDVTELTEEEYPFVHKAHNKITSCFAIFLHSLEGNDEYVLEFFLPLYMKDGSYVSYLVQTLKQKFEDASGFELGEISSPTEVTGPPRDASYLSLSIKPQIVQISSTTTGNTLAFGMDSLYSQSVLANVVKTDSADVQSECSSRENCPNDMSDNINMVGSREIDNATSFSIVINQNTIDTTTNSGVKSKTLKRGRKRKIDSLTMEAVEQHVGKPINQAAESFGVSRSTLKRFCRENGISSWPKPIQNKKASHVTDPKMSHEEVSQRSSQRSSSRWYAIRVLVLFVLRVKRLSCSGKQLSYGQHSYLTSKPDTIYQVAQLTVKATFKGDMIKFKFPISSGLLQMENEIARRLDLQDKKLSIRYKDEKNDLLLITCDNDLHNLPEFLASNRTVRVLVELASN